MSQPSWLFIIFIFHDCKQKQKHNNKHKQPRDKFKLHLFYSAITVVILMHTHWMNQSRRKTRYWFPEKTQNSEKGVL